MNEEEELDKYASLLLRRPTSHEIGLAVSQFLTQSLKEQIKEKLTISRAYKEFSIKWKPSIPSVEKAVRRGRSSTNIKQAVIYLQKVCQFYHDAIPIIEKKQFVEFCFESENNTYRKFAMAVDLTYASVGLVDTNEEIRFIAKLLQKYGSSK